MTLKKQGGGTFLGFIIGLVLGLGIALAVAIYVMKVPTPFSNKNQPRSSAQDTQETEKNKDWNPNSVLQPKAPPETPAPREPIAPTPNRQGTEKTHDKNTTAARPPGQKRDPNSFFFFVAWIVHCSGGFVIVGGWMGVGGGKGRLEAQAPIEPGQKL